jgi:hypothetical protein
MQWLFSTYYAPQMDMDHPDTVSGLEHSVMELR